MTKIKAVSEKQRDYAMSFVNDWIKSLDNMAANWTQRGTQEDEAPDACAAAVLTIEDGKNELIALLQGMDAGQIIDLGKGNVYDDLGRRVESGRKSEIEKATPKVLIRKTEDAARAAYAAWYKENE